MAASPTTGPPVPQHHPQPYVTPQQIGYHQPSGPRVPHDVNRIVAAVLALLIGGLGVHRFYCRKPGLGILYLLFIWTFIPAFIAFIEGIIYLVQDDARFARAQGLAYVP